MDVIEPDADQAIQSLRWFVSRPPSSLNAAVGTTVL
jgi:hypothetical protein